MTEAHKGWGQQGVVCYYLKQKHVLFAFYILLLEFDSYHNIYFMPD